MLATATDKQKDSLKEYMKKIKDIKLRVPEEYLEPIKEHAKKKGMSVNQLVISLLEKDMGMDIVTIREQNKQSKENDEEQEVLLMTALRQSAIMELEKLPEDKLSFIIQIMQGVNGLYTDTNSERKEAFARLEQLRRKGTVTDDKVELASYREEKYGK